MCVCVCVCVCVLMAAAGAGESGKSTVVKQMKIIHSSGFSRDEAYGFRIIIFNNTLGSMRTLLEAAMALNVQFGRETSSVRWCGVSCTICTT